MPDGRKRSKKFHDPPTLPRSAWLDGGDYLLGRGVGFCIIRAPENFAKEVRSEAKVLGIKVKVVVLGSGNVLVEGE
jgi:hypothetical protein